MCHVMLNSMPLLGQHRPNAHPCPPPPSLWVFQKKVLILIITLLQGAAGFFLPESVSAHEYYDKRSALMLSGEWFLLVSAAWAGSNIANLTISGTNLNIKQRGRISSVGQSVFIITRNNNHYTALIVYSRQLVMTVP